MDAAGGGDVRRMRGGFTPGQGVADTLHRKRNTAQLGIEQGGGNVHIYLFLIYDRRYPFLLRWRLQQWTAVVWVALPKSRFGRHHIKVEVVIQLAGIDEGLAAALAADIYPAVRHPVPDPLMTTFFSI